MGATYTRAPSSSLPLRVGYRAWSGPTQPGSTHALALLWRAHVTWQARICMRKHLCASCLQVLRQIERAISTHVSAKQFFQLLWQTQRYMYSMQPRHLPRAHWPSRAWPCRSAGRASSSSRPRRHFLSSLGRRRYAWAHVEGMSRHASLPVMLMGTLKRVFRVHAHGNHKRSFLGTIKWLLQTFVVNHELNDIVQTSWFKPCVRDDINWLCLCLLDGDWWRGLE